LDNLAEELSEEKAKKEDFMKNTFLGWTILLVLTAGLSVNSASAHCEIPCGIYGDEMRFDMIEEHMATIEKSMQMIVELSKEADKNYNQLVRWIVNKEEHANHIQEIISQYFLTQRIKIADEKEKDAYQKYIKQTILLHQMLVYTMKTKQSLDFTNIDRLRVLLEEFEEIYLGHKHDKD
jgi:nickel superoxide dismutase